MNDNGDGKNEDDNDDEDEGEGVEERDPSCEEAANLLPPSPFELKINNEVWQAGVFGTASFYLFASYWDDRVKGRPMVWISTLADVFSPKQHHEARIKKRGRFRTASYFIAALSSDQSVLSILVGGGRSRRKQEAPHFHRTRHPLRVSLPERLVPRYRQERPAQPLHRRLPPRRPVLTSTRRRVSRPDR